MNTKNIILKTFAFLAASLLLFSCSNDDDNNSSTTVSTTHGGFVLNSGIWRQNNSTLSFYNTDSSKLSTNVFEAQNSSLHLGDTGQDILIYGSKMYISVNESGIIYVTNLKGKILDKIIKDQPRYLTSKGKYVYVSSYGGYVSRIDTTTNQIDKQVQVGDYPEQLAISNNNLYVANSRQDSTVSVIDLSSFTKTKDIKVVFNPDKVLADNNGNVYVSSWGKYGANNNSLQRINSDGTIEKIGSANVMVLNNDNSKLYYTYVGDNGTDYKVYDIASKKVSSTPFVNSEISSKFAASPYSLSINPKDGNIYIGVTNYTSEGTMYIVNPTTGNLISSFKTGGINPMGIYFLK